MGELQQDCGLHDTTDKCYARCSLVSQSRGGAWEKAAENVETANFCLPTDFRGFILGRVFILYSLFRFVYRFSSRSVTAPALRCALRPSYFLFPSSCYVNLQHGIGAGGTDRRHGRWTASAEQRATKREDGGGRREEGWRRMTAKRHTRHTKDTQHDEQGAKSENARMSVRKNARAAKDVRSCAGEAQQESCEKRRQGY